MTIREVRIRPLICIAFIALVTSAAFGQSYEWRLALFRGQGFHSIAFNPLSNGRTIFAGTAGTGGVFRTDDGGVTWVLHDSGTADFPMQDVRQVICIPSDTGVVLAVTPEKLYRSTDGGISWSDTSSLGGVSGESICYHAADDAIYYGQNFGYATWKSTDHGATWSKMNILQGNATLCSLGCSVDIPPVLLAGSHDSARIDRSTDEGLTWINIPDTSFSEEVPKIVFSDYATNGDYNHGIAIAARWYSSYTRSLIATTDGGLTWPALASPSPRVWALDIDQRAAMISKSGDPAYPMPLHFWTGLFNVRADTIPNGLVQETNDGGLTWHSTNFPVNESTDSNHPRARQIWVLKYDTLSGKLAVATDSGVFVTDTRLGVPHVESSLLGEPIRVEHIGNQLRIDVEGQTITSIEIYDILGRPVYITARALVELGAINTSSFPVGAYVLKINLAGNAPVERLLTLP
jgi:photosystem II stability/assembly factor-like uncharacterized protein